MSERQSTAADNQRVVVVVPTYDERDNIEPLVAAVRAHGYRLLVVDDASPDRTGEIADRLATADSSIAVLHRQGKGGLGPAYAAGFSRALESDAEVICQMDADFSHDPDDLPRLVAAIDKGADLAIGSRYVPGGSTPDWAGGRRVLSTGGNLYARLLLGGSVHDMTGGFRAWRPTVLRKVDPTTCHASGYAFQVEMAWRTSRAGFGIDEVPIVFRDRRVGESKMSTSIVIEAMALVTTWGAKRLLGRF